MPTLYRLLPTNCLNENDMDVQEIIVYVLVAASAAFLIKKFFFKKKKAGNCGADDCGCH